MQMAYFYVREAVDNRKGISAIYKAHAVEIDVARELYCLPNDANAFDEISVDVYAVDEKSVSDHAVCHGF